MLVYVPIIDQILSKTETTHISGHYLTVTICFVMVLKIIFTWPL